MVYNTHIQMKSPAHQSAANPLRKLFRDAAFALANVILAGFVLLLDWYWPFELLLYFGVMFLLRPLIQRRDDTITAANIAFALVLGLLSYFAPRVMFADSAHPGGPDLVSASGWPLWILLPGICFLIFNAMTFRIKAYRFWTHPLCLLTLMTTGSLAMFELHLLFSHKGFGFNLPAQLVYWSLYCIPMLHDARSRSRISQLAAG